jgi:hypothetical protein
VVTSLRIILLLLMYHFHSSCKGTVQNSEMLLQPGYIEQRVHCDGKIFFCTVGCEVDNLNFFILNKFTLFITTNHKLCVIQTMTSSIYFFWDDWNVLLSCVFFLSSMSYCAWSLSSDTSFSFVYPCSSSRIQTVTGEFPSLLLIQLIDQCSFFNGVGLCENMRKFVTCLKMFGSMLNFVSSVQRYLERVWVTGFKLMGWTYIS